MWYELDILLIIEKKGLNPICQIFKKLKDFKNSTIFVSVELDFKDYAKIEKLQKSLCRCNNFAKMKQFFLKKNVTIFITS